ncbi:MAG: hypothetical protein ACE5FT_06285 [Candidatus Nanoarchaeia archaeon]
MSNKKSSRFFGMGRRSSHKGQMEIMGLAIIVILLTLGVLWAIMSMGDEETSIEEEFETTSLASSFLNTFLGMDTPCANSNVWALLRDCAQQRRITCGSDIDPWGDLRPPGRSMDSCKFVNETLSYVLNQTLDGRAARYMLEAKGSNMELIGASRECGKLDDQVASTQHIPAGRTPLLIQFSICY